MGISVAGLSIWSVLSPVGACACATNGTRRARQINALRKWSHIIAQYSALVNRVSLNKGIGCQRSRERERVAVGFGCSIPPHRSVRADFPHTALASGSDAQTTPRVGMVNAGRWQPAGNQAFLGDISGLAPAGECPVPESADRKSKVNKLYGLAQGGRERSRASRGRDTDCSVPPARIRTSGFPAYDSCLR